MERVGFSMRIASEHVSDYVSMHRHPWPELVDALDRHGWEEYSLFLRDGLLVGYLRTEDWAQSAAGMSAEPIAGRWSVEMDRLVDEAFPLAYSRPDVVWSAAVPPDTVRRRCALVGGDPSRLAARLDRGPAPAGWSDLAVVDTCEGAALYGEHADDAVATWPVAGARELEQIFFLPDLIDAREAATR